MTTPVLLMMMMMMMMCMILISFGADSSNSSSSTTLPKATTHAAPAHDLACHRQAAQLCGKITKFYDSGELRWRDGTTAAPALGCDDPQLNASAPVSTPNCVAIFGRPFAASTVIGKAFFSDWCSAPHQCVDVGAGQHGQPVVICHEPHVDVTACCCDLGQYTSDNFTTTCPIDTPTLSHLHRLEHATRDTFRVEHDTFVHLAIVFGSAIGVVLCIVLAIVVAVCWFSRRGRRSLWQRSSWRRSDSSSTAYAAELQLTRT